MKNHLRNLNVAAGAAVLALVLAAAVGARADDQSTATRSAQQPETTAQMQARMQAMQAQMAQLRAATDPKERERLLAAHMQLMQDQMVAMRMMGGATMQMMHGDAGMGTGTGTGMGSGMHSTGGGMGMQQQAGGPSSTPGPRHQMMEDRVDMLQLMLEQMMGQMQMQSGPRRSDR